MFPVGTPTVVRLPRSDAPFFTSLHAAPAEAGAPVFVAVGPRSVALWGFSVRPPAAAGAHGA